MWIALVGDRINSYGITVYECLIVFSITSSLVLALVGSRVATPSNCWDSPISQCQITPENYRFGLCPLLRTSCIRTGIPRPDLVYETPLTITTIVYNRSLNGSFPKVGGNSQSRAGQNNLLRIGMPHLCSFHHLVC